MALSREFLEMVCFTDKPEDDEIVNADGESVAFHLRNDAEGKLLGDIYADLLRTLDEALTAADVEIPGGTFETIVSAAIEIPGSAVSAEPVAATPAPASEVFDLMAALKASLAATKPGSAS